MDLVRQSCAITFVFLLLWALLWALKRRGYASFVNHMKGSGGNRDIEVIERLNVGPQQSLQLVRVREHVLLIGLSSGKIELLSEITAKDAMPK